jgi:hypothetical protein
MWSPSRFNTQHSAFFLILTNYLSPVINSPKKTYTLYRYQYYYFISIYWPVSKLPEWYLLSPAWRNGWKSVMFKWKANTEYLRSKFSMFCLRAITSFKKIPIISMVCWFPLYHDIWSNFLEKFNDANDVYTSCACPACSTRTLHTNTHTYKTKHNETLSGGSSSASNRWGRESTPPQSIKNLWWTVSDYFVFPPLSFHQCCMLIIPSNANGT